MPDAAGPHCDLGEPRYCAGSHRQDGLGVRTAASKLRGVAEPGWRLDFAAAGPCSSGAGGPGAAAPMRWMPVAGSGAGADHLPSHPASCPADLEVVHPAPPAATTQCLAEHARWCQTRCYSPSGAKKSANPTTRLPNPCAWQSPPKWPPTLDPAGQGIEAVALPVVACGVLATVESPEPQPNTVGP